MAQMCESKNIFTVRGLIFTVVILTLLFLLRSLIWSSETSEEGLILANPFCDIPYQQQQPTNQSIQMGPECNLFFESVNNSDRKEWTGEFSEELNLMLHYIKCRKPMALMRFGDGEFALINGKAITAQVDQWKWTGGVSKVGQGLRDALQVDADDYYIGLPCEDWATVVNNIFSISKQSTAHTSYATVFINRNYEAFKSFFTKEIMNIPKENSDIILVVNENINASHITWAKDVVFIPNEAIVWWEEQEKRVLPLFKTLARSNHRTVFFFSGGPLAKVLIYNMWSANKDNLYIDLGSASDEMIKGFQTRPYQKGDGYYSKHYCKRYRRSSQNVLELKPGQ